MCTRINVDLYLQAFPLLSNLLHMCSRPRVFRFHPATYLGYLPVHVGTSRVFRISHILLPWTFFGVRHIWVTFYLMSNLGGSHLGSDLFSDASTLTNRPQICRGSSLRSIISVSIFSFQRSGKCAATCSKSTAT